MREFILSLAPGTLDQRVLPDREELLNETRVRAHPRASRALEQERVIAPALVNECAGVVFEVHVWSCS